LTTLRAHPNIVRKGFKKVEALENGCQKHMSHYMNAEIFCDCLNWKYSQTATEWQDMDED